MGHVGSLYTVWTFLWCVIVKVGKSLVHAGMENLSAEQDHELDNGWAGFGYSCVVYSVV